MDWPLPRGDLAGSATLNLQNPALEKVKTWQFQAGSHVWSYQPGMAVWSSAALGVIEGRPIVVVGSYDNNLYCLDGITGKKRWRYTTGGGIYAPPVLWRHGQRTLVYAGSSDRLVYALDADQGRREWIYTVKAWRPTIGGARLSSPCLGRVGTKDAVFIGHWVWDKSMSGHLQAGGVTALNALTGKPFWTTELGDNQVSSPLYYAHRGKAYLYVASENGNLYGLEAGSGRVLWTHSDRDAIKGSPVLFTDEKGPRLIIGSKYGRVRCLDALSGVEVWHFKTGHWVDGSAAAALVNGRPVIFIGSYDMQFYALDGRTGAPIWRYPLSAGVYASPAVAQSGTQLKVFITSWDHHLHCLDGATGKLLWNVYLGSPLWNNITLGDSIWASPSVAVINDQEVVYVGSYSGPLYAIPADQAVQEALGRTGSNRRFWVTLPVVMLCTTLLTLFLTFRHRREQV